MLPARPEPIARLDDLHVLSRVEVEVALDEGEKNVAVSQTNEVLWIAHPAMEL